MGVTESYTTSLLVDREICQYGPDMIGLKIELFEFGCFSTFTPMFASCYMYIDLCMHVS